MQNSYYHLKQRSASNNTQPTALTKEVNESNLPSSFLYPKFVTLMKSENKLYRRKMSYVLKYHVPYKHIYPARYSHLLFLFFAISKQNCN